MDYKKYFWITRFSLAFIWFYHGLIPKILFKSETEIKFNNLFLPFLETDSALYLTGILEICFSVCMLVFYQTKVANYIIIIFGVLTGIAISIFFPENIVDAFNPISLNFSMIILSILNLAFYSHMISQEKK